MIDRIFVSEATLRTIERYGQNNLTNVAGKPDEHLCVEFVRAASAAYEEARASEAGEMACDCDAHCRDDGQGACRYTAPAQQAVTPVDEARREFIRKVAAQKPEKPDHWSSCSQCEHNAEEAQDLIDADPKEQA